MEAIINFIVQNKVIVICFAVAAVILALVLVMISLKKSRAKRDEEFAGMFKDVPIESDNGEDVSFGENRAPEFAVSEMDWLKGERGFTGVLRTDMPPLKNAEIKKTAEAENTETENTGIQPEKTQNVPEENAKKVKKQRKKATKENSADIEPAKESETGKSEQLTIDSIAGENVGSEEVAKENNEMAGKQPVKTEAAAPSAKKAVGKWVIKEKGNNEFVAYLYANNKEVMLTSETYSSPDGAKKGIATIRKNAAADENFTYYRDKNKNYYFKLKTAKNRFLCAGATYPNKSACLKSIESVKKFVDSPVSDAIEKDITIIEYVPSQENSESEHKYNGKWVISNIDDMFMAQLFASNGELLLSSESYASATSANEAIANIRKNGLDGNFIIDSDKKGRYFFKLRNAQKQTLCVGETYSQLSACQSAIESVRRFLKTAKVSD